MQKYPSIDFSNHSAFQGLFENYVYDDTKVTALIKAVDESILFTKSKTNNVHEVFDKEINDKINALVEYVREVINSEIAFELFYTSVEYVKDELLKELVMNSLTKNYHFNNKNDDSLSQLNEHGVNIRSVKSDLKKSLQNASRPYYERLKKQAELNPHLRSYENVKRFSKMYKLIDKLVHETGAIKVVSDYMKADMVLMGAGLEYSSPIHKWYKNPYPDINNYETEHGYLHTDEASYFPKALYYLTPVIKVENGATKFIDGSHKAERSAFIFLFQKGLDRISVDRYFKVDNTYYRPLYKNLELRKILAKLPLPLIGSSHLGDDIEVGSELSKKLKEDEIVFISDGSELLVFDGGNGLHKGANVSEGERLSLQIIFQHKKRYKIDRLVKQQSIKNRLIHCLKTFRELYL